VPENFSDTVQFLENKWKTFSPETPFQFNVVDQLVDSQYINDQRIQTIIQFFTILSIFIACLGLFGLVTFMTEKRTKEIGIRKVLGASVTKMIWILSKDYLKWVVIANLVAWPLAYYIMKTYFLQQYAYKIKIGFDILLFATLVSLLIAIFTVCFQSIKASLTNPVETLKYE
jgi:putative ABC transport system permease protein